MNKLKISCFPYKRHDDIYVSRVTFSYDKLLSMLDILPDQKVIALIESDVNFTSIISLTDEGIQIVESMPRLHSFRYTVICSKAELICLLNQANVIDFEGLFIASVSQDTISDEFMHSLEHKASSMVKNGISDISISVNFPENEVIISVIKAKYSSKSIKDAISNILGV